MDLRQLRTLLLVAETGSLSRAANRLRIAQPALSRQIRLLETEVGTALFTRHARGMALTEGGEILVERARGAFRELDQAKSDLMALSGQVTGQIAVGLLPSVSDLMTGRFAGAMRQRYPRVRLRVVTGLATHLLEWLEKQEIDVAIMSEPLVPTNLEFQPLIEEPLFLVGPHAPGARAAGAVPLRQLSDYPLILPSSDFGLRGWIDHVVHGAGVELDVVAEANSVHVQRSLIRADVGFAILPASVVLGEQAADDLQAIPIVDPSIHRRIGLAMPITRRRPLLTRSASELILEQVQASHAAGIWPGARLLLNLESPTAA